MAASFSDNTDLLARGGGGYSHGTMTSRFGEGRIVVVVVFVVDVGLADVSSARAGFGWQGRPRRRTRRRPRSSIQGDSAARHFFQLEPAHQLRRRHPLALSRQ